MLKLVAIRSGARWLTTLTTTEMHPNPTLYCDFTKNSQPIQAGITIAYSGGVNGTRFNELGLIAAASAPRLDYDPTSVRVLNSLLWSEQLDQASWGKTNVAVTANATQAPDGSFTADQMLETGGIAEHYLEQTLSFAGTGTWTASWFVKASGRTIARLVVVHVGDAGTTSEIYFDLANQLTNATFANLITAYSMTHVEQGWYRISVTLTTTGLCTNLRARLGIVKSPSFESYAADTTLGIYAWGAQFEAGSAALKYTPTQNVAVSSPAVPLGLLIEGPETNLLLRSEEFDNAAWAKTEITVGANTTAAPDGAVTGDSLVEGAGGTFKFISQVAAKAASPLTYTFSVWTKRGVGSRDIRLLIGDDATGTNGALVVYNTSTGAVITIPTLTGAGFSAPSSSAKQYPNGWWRFSLTVTSNSAVAIAGIINLINAGAASYAGDGVSSLILWGAQLLQGAGLSSYIPTVAAQVTRTGDIADITSLGGWFDPLKGTLFGEVISGQDSAGANTIASFTDGTSNNRIQLRRDPGGASAVLAVVVAGVTQSAPGAAGSMAVGAVTRYIGTWNLNDFAVAVGGGGCAVGGAGNIPTVNRLSIGNLTALQVTFGHLRRLAYYPYRIADHGLKQLST